MPFFVIVILTMALGTALSILRAFLRPIASLFGQIVVVSIVGVAWIAITALGFAMNRFRKGAPRSAFPPDIRGTKFAAEGGTARFLR